MVYRGSSGTARATKRAPPPPNTHTHRKGRERSRDEGREGGREEGRETKRQREGGRAEECNLASGLGVTEACKFPSMPGPEF